MNLSSKIKIVYIVSTLKRSGPTNQLLNIISYLNLVEFDPYIITLSPEVKDSLIDQFIKRDIKIKSLELNRIQSFYRGKKDILRLLKTISPDLVHTSGIRSDLLSNKLGLPFINTIRNYPFYDYPSSYGLIRGYYYAYKHFSFVKKSKNAILCSESLAKIFYENKKVERNFIRNGVDNKKFVPVSQNEKTNIRKRLNLPIDGKIFISTGHLSKRKDPLTLIEAFKIISTKRDNLYLLLLGDGNQKEVCVSRAHDNSNIIFLGRQNNVIDYLQASDFFVSASKAEGLPNAVLEAMSCGLPVILSDISPHNEILDLDREAGMRFPVFDYKCLIDKIDLITKKDYDVLKRSSKGIIDKFLNAEIMSMSYQDIYKQIIDRQ